MSIDEILEELPKLTQAEKRQLWNALEHELTPEEDEESPELLAAIDEGIHSLETGEKTYTIEEVRQQIAGIVEKARAASRG
jgi:chemotaxis protein histidine kinase CheA